MSVTSSEATKFRKITVPQQSFKLLTKKVAIQSEVSQEREKSREIGGKCNQFKYTEMLSMGFLTVLKMS